LSAQAHCLTGGLGADLKEMGEQVLKLIYFETNELEDIKMEDILKEREAGGGGLFNGLNMEEILKMLSS